MGSLQSRSMLLHFSSEQILCSDAACCNPTRPASCQLAKAAKAANASFRVFKSDCESHSETTVLCADNQATIRAIRLDDQFADGQCHEVHTCKQLAATMYLMLEALQRRPCTGTGL